MNIRTMHISLNNYDHHLQIKNKEGYSPQKLYHPYDVSFLWDDRVVVVEGFWPYSRIQLLDIQGNSIMSLAQGMAFVLEHFYHLRIL